jgi:hypothetical protein
VSGNAEVGCIVTSARVTRAAPRGALLRPSASYDTLFDLTTGHIREKRWGRDVVL